MFLLISANYTMKKKTVLQGSFIIAIKKRNENTKYKKNKNRKYKKIYK